MVILIGYPQPQLEYHMLNKLFGPKSLSRKRLWRRDYLWMRPGDVVSDEVSDDSKLLNPMEGNPFKFVIFLQNIPNITSDVGMGRPWAIYHLWC